MTISSLNEDPLFPPVLDNGELTICRRIFVSSTFTDLNVHRSRVVKLLRQMGQFPILLETDVQRHSHTVDLVQELVASSDVYIGIFGRHYGYIEEATEPISLPHIEYREAMRCRLPCFIFLADLVSVQTADVDATIPKQHQGLENDAQILALRNELMQSHIVTYFTTPDDLERKVALGLYHYLSEDQQREEVVGKRRPLVFPPRSLNFVGRQSEIAEVCADLSSSERVGAILLTGISGVGKSALAVEAVHALAAAPNTFPIGIAWLNCSDRVGLEGMISLYDQLLAIWGSSLPPGDVRQATTLESAVELREKKLRHLFQPTRSLNAPPQALVVLDKAEPELPVSRIVEVLSRLGIALLVTARQQFASPWIRSMTLSPLDPMNAVELFRKRSLQHPNTRHLSQDKDLERQVIAWTQGLPLAIEWVAARASDRASTLQELRQDLELGSKLNLLDRPSDTARLLDSVLEGCVSLLNAKQRVRFASLGLLPGSNWPQFIVEYVFSALSDTQAASEELQSDLSKLAALSLISLQSHDTGKGLKGGSTLSSRRIVVHPLVHDFAQEEWSQQPDDIKRAAVIGLISSVHELVQAFKYDYRALEREENLIVGALRQAVDHRVEPTQVMDIVEALKEYIEMNGKWQMGLDAYELQLAASEQIEDKAGQAASLNNLGHVTHALGEREKAQTYFDKALALYQDVNDIAGLAVTFNNLGTLASASGTFELAERYFQQALTLNIQTADGVGQAATFNNLGTLSYALDRPDEARRYYEQALALYLEVGDRGGQAATYSNLGTLTYALGQPDEAKRYFRHALAVRVATDHRAGQAKVLSSLGALAHASREPGEARRYYEQALALYLEVGDRGGQAATYSNLGALTQAQGDTSVAEEYFRKALEAYREAGAVDSAKIVEELLSRSSEFGSRGSRPDEPELVLRDHAFSEGIHSRRGNWMFWRPRS